VLLLLSALTGALTGLVVTGFERLTRETVFDSVLRWPLAAQAVAPLAGLVLCSLLLRTLGRGASPSTADEYIRNFHEPGRSLDERPVVGRLAAAVATLGLGGALGYEGPSIYAGAAIGSALQRRLRRFFTLEEGKLLLICGAAAGVAAIFKAPVTGLVFALEVPYKEDLARHALLPAAISSAVSYVIFVSFAGTAPFLPVGGTPPFDLVDLGGAALIGIACGVGARLFAAALRAAKQVGPRVPAPIRVAVAGGGLAAAFVLGRAVSGESLTIGPGYDALRWAMSPEHSVLAVLAILALRAAATTLTVCGGGVGGLFIPLVIEGALVGRVVGGLFSSANQSLFPVLGIAAFLGAGYRVPLAAVVFVAEFTGRPGFVVPGLIAAVVAQLAMGRSSVTEYQRPR
jgi:CIC family chloride channel protein